MTAEDFATLAARLSSFEAAVKFSRKAVKWPREAPSPTEVRVYHFNVIRSHADKFISLVQLASSGNPQLRATTILSAFCVKELLTIGRKTTHLWRST